MTSINKRKDIPNDILWYIRALETEIEKEINRWRIACNIRVEKLEEKDKEIERLKERIERIKKEITQAILRRETSHLTANIAGFGDEINRIFMLERMKPKKVKEIFGEKLVGD